ncbi:conserved hypothetical protein [Paraburkholderia piptadeniae]|uniref:Glycosyl transferase family 2 n=1 Tax=Paraburkholderia piptadeniae TaxID=1701573 RepID=A0A1N7SX15_9BURK|nr:glycosyltransferase family 2 protein [Paraburkholderia piptadeniae]SIT52021.1 conserved hypothetical protein [Paraburkholderia piptadeniae]
MHSDLLAAGRSADAAQPGASPLASHALEGETDAGGRSLRLAWYNIVEFSKAHIRRIAKRREVSVVRLDPGLRKARHVLIATVHNEAHRIGFFMRYYRDLGFEHFVIIDNRSTDELRSLLASERGVSLFAADGVYRSARFGNDWVNGVLSKYCVGKWVLYVDADEFLVYPECDTRPISDLTDHLERSGQPSLNGMMVDMYSDRPVSENACASGCDPVTVCRLYDSVGYETRFDSLSRTTWIKGGVRGRLFFPDVWSGPALNKTPLARWRWHFAFVRSSHQLWPPRLNQPVPHANPRMTCALMHFKFLADFKGKLDAEKTRQQHSTEYAAYMAPLCEHDEGPQFVGASTSRYEGWTSLLRDGLLAADSAFLRER